MESQQLARVRASMSMHVQGPAALYAAAFLLGLVTVIQSLAVGSVPSLLIAVALALVGYAARGRWLDAGLYASACIGAALIDDAIGPAALALVTLLTLCLTGRPRLSLVVAGALMGAIVGGAHVMERFASTSLTTQDLHYFAAQLSANREVFASQPSVNTAVLGGAAAFVLVIAAACFLDGAAPTPRPALARLAGCLALAACCAVPVAQLAAQAAREPAPNLQASHPAQPVLTFVSTLFSHPVATWQRVPTGAFAREVQAMLATHAPLAAAAPRPADIVLFLQESQFNPATVQGCPPALCTLAAFEPASTTRDHGPLRVPVHGSGTWLSEFALLTGLPHTLWGRAARYAPYNVAPRVQRSFVHTLKDAGYYTVALVPTQAEFMNARQALAAYGFDEVLDSRDMHSPTGFSAPDAVIHQAALAALARGRRNDRPVFVYALTIFNHSEHGIALERVPSDIRQAMAASVPDTAQAESLADYVWRSREFSKSFEATSQQLLSSHQPAVIAWFGDHQPPFALAPELRARIPAIGPGPAPFTTWYAVRSNLAPASPAPTQAAPLDLSFLPGLLAERAGVPLDAWLAANVLTRRRCGGSLPECAQAGAANEYITYLMDTLGVVGD